MTRPSRVSGITSSLSFKLFVVLFLAILTLFLTYAAIVGHVQRHIFENQVKADAYRASSFIRQSLLSRMLRNEREEIYTIISGVGEEPSIDVIRIYNKQGEIQYSNIGSEIGQAVDLEAEACYACHATSRPLEALPTGERARIYRKEDGHRVLALINPIHNAESCSSAECHAHPPTQSILGVLDVQMSMRSVDAALATARYRTFGLALAIILVATLLIAVIVYRGVHRPTRVLRAGTEALAAGDRSVTIPLRRSDELGLLAESFNRMARSLEAADAELRTWSRTLEDRVREKTGELEEITEQMVRVEKAASLGRMAATVAHELNNPLTGIVTYAKLVHRRMERAMPAGEERDRVLEHLDLIRSEAMRCGNIARDLLTYARQGKAELRPAHLHPVVAQALKLVRHHMALRGIKTETDLLLADDQIVCDPEQIEQALIALLVNAVEAMPDGGIVTVGTSAPVDEPASIRLRVTDTGVGIPAAIQERLFDPFFSTKSDTKGVGLGLAVVYGIVQRHEGTITVRSVQGQGTTFTITLPRDPDEVARARAQPSHLHALHS